MAEVGSILIVDDEESFLRPTADLLRREGYECDCVTDIKTAKRMLGNEHYDLLIADIKMQGNWDLEFIKELPTIVEGLPAILVTGYPSLNSAIQSIELPVVAYLIKPFELNELLESVRKAITGRQLQIKAKQMERTLQNIADELEEVGIVTEVDTSTHQPDSLKGLDNLTHREWKTSPPTCWPACRSYSPCLSPKSPHGQKPFEVYVSKLGVRSQTELLEFLRSLTPAK